MTKLLNQYNLIFLLSLFFLTFIFIFNPHFLNSDDVVQTWLFSKGLVWNRDFPAFHFPLAHLTSMPLHLITNWDLIFDPFLGLLTGYFTLLLIFYYGKKYLTQSGTSLSLIFFSIYFWFYTTGILYINEALMGMFLFWGFFIYRNILEKKSERFLLLGIVLSLAELSGQIVSITVLTIICLLIVHLKKLYPLKKIIKIILIFSLGFLLPFIPLLIYYYSNDALSYFIHWNFLYYFTYAAHDKNLAGLPFKELTLFYSPLILVSLLNIYNFIKNKKIGLIHLDIILVSASTIPFVIFGVFHFHHLVFALPFLSITLGYADKILLNTQKKQLLNICSASLILISLFTIILPWHIARLKYPPNFTIMNDIQPNDDMDQTITWVKQNTKENDKIMVFADPLFYVKSNRLPASRPSLDLPYSWEPFQEIKIELAAKPPNYWIVGRDFVRRIYEDYNDKEMVNFLNQELHECYIEKFNNITWQIWQRTCNSNL